MSLTIPYRIAQRQPRASAVRLVAYAPIALAIVLRLASAPTADLSYLVIAAYALLGRTQAIRALALSWLFTMLSGGVAPEAGLASLGRYAVLFGAAASAVLHGLFLSRSRRKCPLTAATVFLGLFVIGHSFLFSAVVDVSVLKAVSWTLAMATLLSAWCGLSERERDELAKQLFWGLAGILLLSLPLLFSPLGYLRNGTGFQGILNHPQAFGPTMALLGAWAAARLFGQRRPPWWLIAVAGGALLAILMSEARAGGLAMVLAVGLSVLLGPGLAGRSIGQMAPGLRSARVWTVLGGLLVAGVVMAPKIADLVDHYVTKSGRSNVGGLLEAYDQSRGRLIDAMLENISERPFSGIGFGVASDPFLMDVQRDPVLGLPVGASIEKGVAPLMVLEELGIVGALLAALWVFALLRGSARSGLAPFAVCLTALLLNLAEATLFSPGGFGLLLLILLGWTYASGDRRQKVRRG